MVTLLSLWFCFIGVRESIAEGAVVHAGNCHEGDLSSEILLISVQNQFNCEELKHESAVVEIMNVHGLASCCID
jgi:hypothetical protein